MNNIDVVALGELLIDFTHNGASEQGNPMFEANPGGAPCNVLSMLSKLGHKAAFIGKVGDDIFGKQLKEAIDEVGIDSTGLCIDKEVHTTLAFVQTFPGGDRDFSFYRNPGADMMLTKDDINEELIKSARIFHFGTLSMTDEPCREATKMAIDIAKENGKIISFDPNLREPLWKDLNEAKEQAAYGMSKCDILKISDNEVVWFTGETDYEKGIEKIRTEYSNIKLLLFSMGKDGSKAYAGNEQAFVPAFVREDTIETTGAGDTFGACSLHYVLEHGLDNLTEDNLKELLRFSNAAASIVTTRKGALRVMPSEEGSMATIKDVAREAGLTVTTVSRVLNNRGYISDDARKRVSEAMKKLNYQPNEMARSLQNRKSNVIGVIVPHIKHPYFAEMISRIEGEAYKLGYRILLFNTQEKTEKGKEYLDICTSNRVAGIILFSAGISVELFSELDIPVVTMERKIDSGTASVECDNKAGGELAARKLIDSGCKKLLLIGSNTGSEALPAGNRAIGFREVCEKEGIEYHEINPRMQDYFDMVYQGLVSEALMEYPETDGIFASSDVIAAQIIQVCNAIGKNIPRDLKLVGFDDTMISRLTMPQLTTIHQPIQEMVELAVKIIKDAGDGKIVPQQTILPVSLIERDSTAV